MVIRSQECSYEVIRALPGEGGILRYLCKNKEAEDLHTLVCMGVAEELIDFFPILSDMEENPAFTDLKEYFLENDKLWMVFPWQEGKSLEEYMKEDPALTERFDIGRFIMERMILMAMPPYLMLHVLTTKAIQVTEDKSPVFCYSFGAWRAFTGATAESAAEKLGLLLKFLFAREEESGLYPEWSAWLGTIKPGGTIELLDIYKTYLELTPVFSEQRKKEKKPGLKERCIALLPRAIGLFKIILGLTVLVAAAAAAVGMWKDNVAPVLEAASKWKAVYVDGETLAPESESETEQDQGESKETETDPDNGNGQRYREDGSLCYKGDLKDGLYDGTGILYYPNGAVAYEGSFSLGRKEGQGYQYTDTGILYYEGEFKNDRFEGGGRLYDPDTGMLIYEGGFENGRYGGEGVLYDPETEFPRYVGSFRLGKYDGQGLEYDGTGSLLYEGEFLLGTHHGEGVLYDPGTGAVLMEGQFRNDIFVSPAGDGGDGEGTDVGNGEGSGAADAEDGETAAEAGASGPGVLAGTGSEAGEENQENMEGDGAAGDNSAKASGENGGPGAKDAAAGADGEGSGTADIAAGADGESAGTVDTAAGEGGEGPGAEATAAETGMEGVGVEEDAAEAGGKNVGPGETTGSGENAAGTD